MSNSLQPHGWQHTRLLYPSLFPGSFLKLMSIELMMPSNSLIHCHSLLLLPSIFPSIRVFSNESVLHIWWLKYWIFIFSIRPSNEYSGLISFRIGYPRQSRSPCLLAVQGTLKSLLEHHSSKASIFWCSVFFMVQLSDAYITSGKNHSFNYIDFCQQSDVSSF